MRASQIGVGFAALPREIWGFDDVLTDCFFEMVKGTDFRAIFPCSGPPVANYALANMRMRYMHIHTCDIIKMPPVARTQNLDTCGPDRYAACKILWGD